MSTATYTGRVPGYLIVYFGALIALGPISMNIYLPAVDAIAADFGIEDFVVNYTLSVFLLGYAFGQLFGGAFSDQVGRKRIGYTGLVLYLVSTVAISMTSTIEQMLVLRFLQAIGGGFSTVICMATVRDVYPIAQLGRRFATITAIVLVAPLVGPTLGSALLGLGWQAIFGFKAMYAGFLLVLYVITVPETVSGRWSALSTRSVFLSCWDVLTRSEGGRRIPLRIAVAAALASSVLMNFVTNSWTVYVEYFGIGPGVFPWMFALTVFGFMCMNFVSMRFLRPGNARRLFGTGLRIQLGVVLLLLACVVGGITPVWLIVPLLVVAISMLGLVGPAGSSTFMSHFARLAGSAASTYTTLMFTAGGMFGALTAAFYDGTLLPLALTMTMGTVGANWIASPLLREDAQHP